jgi:hypothetical protein
MEDFKKFWNIVLTSIMPTFLISGILMGIFSNYRNGEYIEAGILILILCFLFSYIIIAVTVKIKDLQRQIDDLTQKNMDIDKEFESMFNEMDKKYGNK